MRTGKTSESVAHLDIERLWPLGNSARGHFALEKTPGPLVSLHRLCYSEITMSYLSGAFVKSTLLVPLSHGRAFPFCS
jgi:hypothetical protein